MTAPLETLSDQALGLTPAERIHLARTLIKSVEGHEEGSLEAAWEVEIAERLGRFQTGARKWFTTRFFGAGEKGDGDASICQVSPVTSHMSSSMN